MTFQNPKHNLTVQELSESETSIFQRQPKPRTVQSSTRPSRATMATEQPISAIPENRKSMHTRQHVKSCDPTPIFHKVQPVPHVRLEQTKPQPSLLLKYYQNMFNLHQYNEELVAQRQQQRQHHRPNCSCNCNVFDESELTHVNKQLLRNLNSMSVPQLYANFNDQGCNYQPVMREHSCFEPVSLGDQRVLFNQQWAAATLVQKLIRGRMARKRINQTLGLYQLFKKAEKRVLVRELICGMKDAYISVKAHKQVFIQKYVNNSASKIQKYYRGWMARKGLDGLTAFDKERINGLIAGWRIRRIFRTKEVKQRIAQIREFAKAHQLAFQEWRNGIVSDQYLEGLQKSRQNTVAKMILLIEKMETEGLWLTYRQSEEYSKSRGTFDRQRTSHQSELRQRPPPKESPREEYCQPTTFKGTHSHQYILTQPDFGRVGKARNFHDLHYSPKKSDRTREQQLDLLKRRTSYDPLESSSKKQSHFASVQLNQRRNTEHEDAKRRLEMRTSYDPMKSASSSPSKSKNPVSSSYAQEQIQKSLQESQSAWRLKRLAQQAKPINTGLPRYDKINNALQSASISQIVQAKTITNKQSEEPVIKNTFAQSLQQRTEDNRKREVAVWESPGSKQPNLPKGLVPRPKSRIDEEPARSGVPNFVTGLNSAETQVETRPKGPTPRIPQEDHFVPKDNWGHLTKPSEQLHATFGASNSYNDSLIKINPNAKTHMPNPEEQYYKKEQTRSCLTEQNRVVQMASAESTMMRVSKPYDGSEIAPPQMFNDHLIGASGNSGQTNSTGDFNKFSHKSFHVQKVGFNDRQDDYRNADVKRTGSPGISPYMKQARKSSINDPRAQESPQKSQLETPQKVKQTQIQESARKAAKTFDSPAKLKNEKPKNDPAAEKKILDKPAKKGTFEETRDHLVEATKKNLQRTIKATMKLKSPAKKRAAQAGYKAPIATQSPQNNKNACGSSVYTVCQTRVTKAHGPCTACHREDKTQQSGKKK